MIYIIGAGVFGTVMAERITSVCKKQVTLIDKRDHIGGNCYTFDDPETGINCHKYGAHIFHTSNKQVYNYLTSFIELNSYHHIVMTRGADGKVYPMPIGLQTVNKFFQKEMNPSECQLFLSNLIEKSNIVHPHNLEEQAISLIGKDLYQAFIRGYTKKQWQRDPKALPADIIKRLPFRTSYNQEYFSDYYQGIPKGGYTKFFEKALSNQLISLRLKTNFNDIKQYISEKDLIIYTGAPDEYFDYCFGHLQWRSLKFEWEIVNTKDFQGCAVMNEASEDIPYTRTHEFKHFHPENVKTFNLERTVICREYSHEYKPGDTPYYPVNTKPNQDILKKYMDKAKLTPNLIFGGRLGTYKYMDIDKVIQQALECFDKIKDQI